MPRSDPIAFTKSHNGNAVVLMITSTFILDITEELYQPLMLELSVMHKHW